MRTRAVVVAIGLLAWMLVLVACSSTGPTFSGESCYFDDDLSAGIQGTLSKVSGDGETHPTGTAFAIGVQLFDVHNPAQPLCLATIDWIPGANSGTAVPGESTTGQEFSDSGKAGTTWTLGSAVGTQTLVARVRNSIPTLEVTFTATATATSSCNPAPASTLQDDFSVGTQWTAVVYREGGTVGHTETTLATNGNPGGYRSMTHTLGPPPAASDNISRIYVAHLFTGGTYDPGSGAICELVYSEDQISPDGRDVAWGIAVRQGGQIYTRDVSPPYVNSITWVAKGPITIRANEFTPAPGPDFTTSGSPIEFGFFRANSTSANPTTTVTIPHGIDDWKVEIRRP